MKPPVIGKKIHEETVDSLIDVLEILAEESASLYVGYPIASTVESSIAMPALLISERFGIVCIDIAPYASMSDLGKIKKGQRDILLPLKAKLLANPELAGDEDLAFKVNVITFSSGCDDEDLLKENKVAVASTLKEVLDACSKFPGSLLPHINAAIERVANIRPRSKRESVVNNASMGGILKKIEAHIANLDSWQKAAAIETPQGPQRIRGLAGSGKTIVLALKAAYLHGENKDWIIGVTFHTRSLTQQMKSLIKRFYFEDYRDYPDDSRLQIMHSFGSLGEDGIYSTVCKAYGVIPRDFTYAKRTYGYSRAFAGICAELLPIVEANPKKIFDALLIDEAQDLPKEFLKIAYLCTEGHRIVWAYDDLQNLGDYQMTSLADTFGGEADGSPRVHLRNRPKQPREDIVLPICYRNTPWALVTAHALGSGIYREQGLVQHPDDPTLWNDIGYEVVSGSLELGRQVILQRRPDAAPAFFRELINPEDAVQFYKFDSDRIQFKAVADQIKEYINGGEIFPHDIAIVFPNAIEAAKRAALLKQFLFDEGVDSHIVGVTSSKDSFFINGKVAISGPFRAKGNEAPVIYVLDAEYCAAGIELIKKRNILFTAITRSRGWVRVMGVGSAMQIMMNEYDCVRRSGYKLNFSIPDKSQLTEMRTIYRDVTQDEIRRVSDFKKAFDQISGMSPAVLQALPKEVRDEIIRSLSDLDGV